MTNDYPKDINIKFNWMGIYQLAGGIVGLGFIILLITRLPSFSIPFLLIILISLGLFLYSIYCGTLLIKRKKSGLNHSLINQFLQLVNFSIAGFAISYVSGLFISAGVESNDSHYMQTNIGISGCKIAFNSDNETFLINFNFLALFLIIFLFRLKKKISEDEFDVELSQP